MTASWLGLQGADRTAARSQPWRRLRRKIDRWFQPRELILRADGRRVSYLAVSARQQKIAFVFLLGFILWGGFATAGMIISNRQLAAERSVVVFAGWKGSYGPMVEIDHGLGVHTRYAHLARIDVKRGDAVDYRGQVGLLGSWGRSNGAHVHYEVRIDGRPLDPMNFLKAGRYVFKG
jgi:peptidase M23-like protein